MITDLITLPSQEWIINHIEKKELSFLMEIVKDTEVVIDIGANFGTHSLNYATENNIVYAIEPSIENYDILQKNIERHNKQNIKPLNLALGKEKSTIDLYVNRANCGDNRIYLTSDYTPANSHKVAMDTLDSLVESYNINRVDYIKIDTQGCELDIFEGGWNTFTKNKPDVFLEFWPWGLNQKNSSNISVFKDIVDSCQYNMYMFHKHNGLMKYDMNQAYDFYKTHSNINFHINLFSPT